MPIPHLKPKSSWRDTPKTKTPNNKKLPRSFLANILRRRFLTILMILGAIFLVFILIFIIWISRDLPNPNQLINREVAQSTKIYDRTGEHILYEVHGSEKRTLVDLKNIPDSVKQATISIEDKNFYKHGGFSLWAIFRTIITNVIYNRSAGGSTLTQQLVKNAILTSEKSITRKVKELIIAQRIEKKFSKDEILQMYLNEIPYGSNSYGVEAASQRYFGKSVKDVNLAEAAILAALPQAPSRYSPYGPNRELLIGRKDYILDLMVEQGYINKEQGDEAKKMEIKFQPPENNITAPHFVMYIKDILSEKYGEKTVEQGGLKIYTSLDFDKQKIAEEIITEKTKNYSKKYNAHNAALVSIDPKNGQILAMVGSRDYFDDSIDGQVNVVTSPRQPGSSMKPIVYATLFERGYTPNTILYDVNTNFSNNPTTPYEPRNYDNKERGPVSIRQALAGSLNIPAVKAIYLAGIKNVIEVTNKLGYTTLTDPDRYGLSLVLGGGEVKLLEHTNAYSAFANEGEVFDITPILKIEDKNGNILEETKPNGHPNIISQKTARMINSVLSDNSARTFIFSAQNYLNLGERPVGAKTGTTNDFKDAWTIGYTPSLVTGVWVGNNDSSKMKTGSDGSVLAAPIWHDFMKKALEKSSVEYFTDPGEIKTGKAIIDGDIGGASIIKIDKISGLLATSSTPPDLIEEKSFPSHHCILYYIDPNDPLNPQPTNPEKDPQFYNWEKAVKLWESKTGTSSSSTAPTTYDNIHTEENQPIVSIIEPTENFTITNGILSGKISATAPRGIKTIEYFIDDSLLWTAHNQETIITQDLSQVSGGYHKFKIRACDDALNCQSKEVNFNNQK